MLREICVVPDPGKKPPVAYPFFYAAPQLQRRAGALYNSPRRRIGRVGKRLVGGTFWSRSVSKLT